MWFYIFLPIIIQLSFQVLLPFFITFFLNRYALRKLKNSDFVFSKSELFTLQKLSQKRLKNIADKKWKKLKIEIDNW